MSLVRGENVIVAEYNSIIDGWVLYGCARTCSLNVTTDFVETSVSGTGKFATFKPSKISVSGSLEGLVNIGATNLLSLSDLRKKQLDGTPILLRFQRIAIDGVNNYVDEFTCYISASEDNGAVDGMNSFTVEFKGTGQLTQLFTATPLVPVTPGTPIYSNLQRIEYTGTGGETVVTLAGLIGKTVLAVHKDGIGNSKLITSGTPSDKQVKFTTATGVLQFAIPFEPGEESYILFR